MTTTISSRMGMKLGLTLGRWQLEASHQASRAEVSSQTARCEQQQCSPSPLACGHCALLLKGYDVISHDALSLNLHQKHAGAHD